MDAIHSCLIQSAVGLMRTGHFSEASSLLGASHREGRSSPKLGPLGEALLSDALQRIGRNDETQRIATKALANISQSSHVAARCHFVLGSILRERGNTAESIERLQIAGRLSHHDLELSCWIQLRLVAAIADLRGNHAALACLDETKRILTRFGDARPFAALHLWLVEAEAKLGHFIRARHHLKTAASLLHDVDDVWLQGYLAVNSSAMHYYSADIATARVWAETAIKFAHTSGHRTTRRSAYVNLGNIEFAQGHLDHAEECFKLSLQDLREELDV